MFKHVFAHLGSGILKGAGTELAESEAFGQIAKIDWEKQLEREDFVGAVSRFLLRVNQADLALACGALKGAINAVPFLSPGVSAAFAEFFDELPRAVQTADLASKTKKEDKEKAAKEAVNKAADKANLPFDQIIASKRVTVEYTKPVLPIGNLLKGLDDEGRRDFVLRLMAAIREEISEDVYPEVEGGANEIVGALTESLNAEASSVKTMLTSTFMDIVKTPVENIGNLYKEDPIDKTVDPEGARLQKVALQAANRKLIRFSMTIIEAMLYAWQTRHPDPANLVKMRDWLDKLNVLAGTSSGKSKTERATEMVEGATKAVTMYVWAPNIVFLLVLLGAWIYGAWFSHSADLIGWVVYGFMGFVLMGSVVASFTLKPLVRAAVLAEVLLLETAIIGAGFAVGTIATAQIENVMRWDMYWLAMTFVVGWEVTFRLIDDAMGPVAKVLTFLQSFIGDSRATIHGGVVRARMISSRCSMAFFATWFGVMIYGIVSHTPDSALITGLTVFASTVLTGSYAITALHYGDSGKSPGDISKAAAWFRSFSFKQAARLMLFGGGLGMIGSMGLHGLVIDDTTPTFASAIRNTFVNPSKTSHVARVYLAGDKGFDAMFGKAPTAKSSNHSMTCKERLAKVLAINPQQCEGDGANLYPCSCK